MALGTLLGAAATAAATAGASKLASNVLGGDSENAISGLSSLPRGVGFSGGGLRGTFGGGGFNVSSNANRTGTVNNLASLFPQQANLIRKLRGQVTPGFGRLTEARVNSLRNNRTRAIGDLRDMLQRRRVLGSSFAADTQARAEAEFAQQEAEIRAQSFLEELQLSQQLLNQEFETRRGEFETLLSELNVQADAALQLATGAASQLGANQRLQAQLAADDLQGIGAALEPSITQFSNAVGGGVSRLFGGGAAPLTGWEPTVTFG